MSADETMDEYNTAWWKAFDAAGHTPVLDEDGRRDIFVHDAHFCNGPGCTACGENWCMQCTHPEKIAECRFKPKPPPEPSLKAKTRRGWEL